MSVQKQRLDTSRIIRYSNRAKRFAGSFLGFFLVAMFCMFIISGVVLIGQIWNSNFEKIHLLDPNFETIGLATSIYSWQDEGTSPIQISVVENPDRKNESVFSIQKKSSKGWSGIGKPVLLETPLSLNEAITLSVKNLGEPFTLFFELEEKKTPTNPIAEVWQQGFRLDQGQWKTIEIPLSTLYQKALHQSTGQVGNQVIDFSDLSQFDLLFPTDVEINLLLGSIYINQSQYLWTFKLCLFLNLFWWTFLFYYALHNNITLIHIHFILEAIKFCLYQLVIILSPGLYEIGWIASLLIGYSLIESIIQLQFQERKYLTAVFALLSPWVTGLTIFLLFPNWMLMSLLVAVHCFRIQVRLPSHPLRWSLGFWFFIQAVGILRFDSTIYPIPSGVGLASLTVLHYLVVEQKKYAQWGREQRDHRLFFEQQVNHGQTLEAFGQMNRFMAHEFNNMLTGIIGNLRLAQIRKNQDTTENIQKALDSAYQAAEAIKKIQHFSHISKVKIQPMELNSLVLETQVLFNANLDESIQFECHLPDQSISIQADPMRIKTVLMSLLINARSFIETDLKTGNRKDYYITVDAHLANGVQIPDNLKDMAERYVQITIADNGIGMESSITERIFDPFFTSSKLGFNTGLGLASAYEIIKDHKGWIEVDSRIHEGTAFHIFLPVD